MATLSADKATVYLTNDEGEDIILTDLDWADLGNANTYNFTSNRNGLKTF